MKWFFQRAHHDTPLDNNNNREEFLRLNYGSVRIIVVTLMILFLGVFIAGYYWGKKSAIEQLMENLDQESFADKIYTSMCSWDESNEESKEKESTSGDNDVRSDNDNDEEAFVEFSQQEPLPRFVAQLAGFGSHKAAQAYQIRLHNKGVEAHIVERQSGTAAGKKRLWYQVVTLPMERSMIDEMVNKLIQEDKLTSVNIIETNEEGRAL